LEVPRLLFGLPGRSIRGFSSASTARLGSFLGFLFALAFLWPVTKLVGIFVDEKEVSSCERNP
jgi:hypothetical protein